MSSTNWQQVFDVAIREPGSSELAELVSAAEAAIFARWQELGEKSAMERASLVSASRMLRELQVKKLNFPRWKGELQS